MSCRRSYSALRQICFMAAVNSESGLTCGLGRYWRPMGHECSLANFLRPDRDFLVLTRLVSMEAILFLNTGKLSAVLRRLGAGWEDGMSSSDSDHVRLDGDRSGEIGAGAWLSLISASMAATESSS